MKVEKLLEIIGADFYTGVPDSQLKALCDYLMNLYNIDNKHHIIAANEGNCVAIAAGYYLATGKIPVVYLQNSGQGNILNPVNSLLNDKVYAIPMVFIIGWRGEPGVKDEPQHIFQGEVTLKLLECMEIETCIIGEKTSEQEIKNAIELFRDKLNKGKSVCFLIAKNGLSYKKKLTYTNRNSMAREEVIRHIVNVSKEDPIISTTGKISRELFEIREQNEQSHMYDFLTVGSMGHASSIAYGVAISKPKSKIWCIDGDGAALMHMGAMAVIAAGAPRNLIHIVINNGAHESVGGMPTVAEWIDLAAIAKACGYSYSVCVDNFCQLDKELKMAKERDELSYIEIKTSIYSRENLGRPTIDPINNKNEVMKYLNKK